MKSWDKLTEWILKNGSGSFYLNTRLEYVKEQVLKTFDVEVQERLKLAREQTSAFINRYEYIFWELTKNIDHSFILKESVGGSHLKNCARNYFFVPEVKSLQ